MYAYYMMMFPLAALDMGKSYVWQKNIAFSGRKRYNRTGVSKIDDRGCFMQVRKVRLHRAGCQITSGGGDSKASATEIYRRLLAGKGGKAV